MGYLTLDDLFEPPDGRWNKHWRLRDWRELLPIVRERIAERLPEEYRRCAKAPLGIEAAVQDYINWLTGSRWYNNAKRPTA